MAEEIILNSDNDNEEEGSLGSIVQENIEEDITQESKKTQSKDNKEQDKGASHFANLKNDKRFMFLFAVLSGVFVILLTIMIFLFAKASTPEGVIIPESAPQEQPVTLPQEDSSSNLQMQKIDSMIQKANALYLKGQMQQALEIYEQIAVYSEALSNYNLGVSQMRQGNFDLALESFQKAIASNENQTVSAINAAVCALYLNDEAKFKYYIDLAYIYLPNEARSQLFEYYLSLINYYKGFYPEALQSLQAMENESYSDDAKYLSAKIYAKMGLEEKAIKQLQEQGTHDANLALGLLHANLGQYDKAITHLQHSLKIDRDRNASIAALNLIDLKTGQYQDLISRIGAYTPNTKAILDLYKIKVRIKRGLSDTLAVQRTFAKDFMPDKKAQADLLFYFAPYQVFDSRQALRYINKANMIDFLQDSKQSEELLATSQNISSVNVKIAQIINQVLNHELRKSNQDFMKLLSQYQEHSILHYNLALSYAQLQNYHLAYKHFASSYHLNPQNYAAGALAVLAGSLSDKDTRALVNQINENIETDPNFKAQNYKNIIALANNESVSMLPFLEDDSEINPFNLMFKAIIAKNNNLKDQSNQFIFMLKDQLKDDALANILFFNAQNQDLSIKEYAQNAQIYFKNFTPDYKALAGSAVVLRDDFLSLMRVSGLLNKERENLKEKLSGSSDDESLIAMLAYMDIYAGIYNEAYDLYTILIDDYGIKDSMTYFLAAVAAIGANNPNAAIALLELSKLEDTGNQETRVALGLLYQEVQNYEPALFHYGQVKDGFQSNFFTFDIRK